MEQVKIFLIKLMSFIIRLIPKNRRLWIFGSRFGQTYDQNSRYVFEYVHKNAKDIRTIWLTKNQKVYDYLRKNGYEVYISRSFFGWFYSIIAGAVFVNVSSHDINHFAISGSLMVQLCHGTPLKMINIRSFGPNEQYDIIILAAEEFLHNRVYPEFKTNHGFLANRRKSHLILTGYPRTDILLSKQKIESIELLKSKYKCSRMVLYAPTHRDKFSSDDCIEEFDLFEGFGLDLDRLETIMKHYKCLFIFKVHPCQRIYNSLIIKRIQKSSNFYMVDSEDPLQDTYHYLKYTDILITDYSSIYFDFLLLDRPIIFAPFDFDDFVKNRPFVFKYDEVTPGPKAKNWEEVCSILEDMLAGRDDRRELRKSVNRRFNTFRDGDSSERVYKTVRAALGI